ncbi:MAG: glycosyltransferase family A protein [Candidatus Buchananbacteria bacterium]
MPKISIVIPIYNSEKTLKPCLESIFNQTFKDFEIVAVNDGSTDQSKSILDAYQDKIKIINQKNQGAAAARNTGAKEAVSQFIIFCDSDIILKPDALKKMHQALILHPEASYAYSAFIFGKKTFKLWPFDAAKLKKMPYIHTTSLIRKKDFPGFDVTLKRFQDWDLWLTMLEDGHQGIFIDEILFTVKAGGTMSNWLPKMFYYLPFLSSVKKYQNAKKIIQKKHNLY